MAAEWEIWMTDAKGARIADENGGSLISDHHGFTVTKTANRIATFSLSLPAYFDTSVLRPDNMVQFLRRPAGGDLGLWQVYFMRRVEFDDAEGQQSIIVKGPDPKELLRRRHAIAYAGSAEVQTTSTPADDLMKAIVTDSQSDVIEPTPDAGTRNWDNFTVADDLSLGPSIDKDFAWQKLLENSGRGVLAEIADQADQAGTPVFFDVVPVLGLGSIAFRFVTAINRPWPGSDIRDLFTFGTYNETMRACRLIYDYTDEENYIYAGGQGQGLARNIQQVYDATRYSASPWARMEGFASANNAELDGTVIATGNVALKEGEPRILFSGEPLDSEAAQYGVDWDFGDTLKARSFDREFITTVKSLTITVDKNGGEKITSRLDWVEA